jgi:hypothetical protein
MKQQLVSVGSLKFCKGTLLRAFTRNLEFILGNFNNISDSTPKIFNRPHTFRFQLHQLEFSIVGATLRQFEPE